jgi:hypothetical protein
MVDWQVLDVGLEQMLGVESAGCLGGEIKKKAGL